MKKASKRLYFLSRLKRAIVQTMDLMKYYASSFRSLLRYACEFFNFSSQEKLKLYLERIKKTMRNIHGFWTKRMMLSGMERLSVYGDKLGDDFQQKISVNSEDELYIPHNMNRDFPLRNIRKFTVPKK